MVKEMFDKNKFYTQRVNEIKAIGEHLINNAENILSDFYTENIKEITIVSSIKPGEIPTVDVTASYIPRGIFESQFEEEGD